MASALVFSHVSKRFVLQHERAQSLQERFVRLFRFRQRTNAEEFWVLRDVSFAVEHGETFGIIGRNGAGKSTLLKLATGILQPTSGRIRRGRRVYAMLELGAGFHPELTGRDNIFLSGSIHGFSRQQMRALFDRIVAFAELERFIDTPVKHYSSGMYMRLGFATAIHMEPELLVIDEIMAVGDAAFQRKCTEALWGLKRRGATILFVSHNEGDVFQFCDRAMLLSGGQTVALGEIDEVVAAYTELTQATPDEVGAVSGARLQILAVAILDARGHETLTLTPGEPWAMEVVAYLPHGGAAISGDVNLHTETGTSVVVGQVALTVAPWQTGVRHLRADFEPLRLSAGRLRAGARLRATTPDGAVHLAEHGSPYTLTVGGQGHGPLLDLASRWRDVTDAANPIAIEPPAPGAAAPAAPGAAPARAEMPTITALDLPATTTRQRVAAVVGGTLPADAHRTPFWIEVSLDGETFAPVAEVAGGPTFRQTVALDLALPAAGGTWAAGDRAVTLRIGDGGRVSAAVARTIGFAPPAITTLCLADGYTGGAFETRLWLANPGDEPVTVAIAVAYAATSAGPPGALVALAPGEVRALALNEVVGDGKEFALALRGDGPFLAERITTFARYPGLAGIAYNRAGVAHLEPFGGGHVATATPPAPVWHLADGYTGAGFESYLVLHNPADRAVVVAIAYILADGRTVERGAVLAPQQRLTVAIHDADDPAGLGPDRIFSAVVRAAGGAAIAVERVTYFRYRGPAVAARGAVSTAGTPAAATRWYLGEVGTRPGQEPYLALLNPNPTPVAVTLTYLVDGAPAPLERALTLAPASRASVNVFEPPSALHPGGLGPGAAAAARIDSSAPIAVERPLYTADGGHATAGTAEPLALGQRATFISGIGAHDHLEARIIILNPNPTPATVALAWRPPGRPHRLALAPWQRLVLAPAELPSAPEGPALLTVAVVAAGDEGLVVERMLYFRHAADTADSAAPVAAASA